jgi:transglutaminase-like putative cysteine protease
MMNDIARYLTSGTFIDSESPQVIVFANQTIIGANNTSGAVLRLYYTIRDTIIYDPYVNFADPAYYRASGVLALGRGFCIGKSALLAASARVIGVPARVGYADVRNHLTSPRLYEKIKTDIFLWHSYTELYLSGRWVKATPAFDRALCDRINLRPLEFDGSTDSLFQPFDQGGRRHMEYLRYFCRCAIRHHKSRISYNVSGLDERQWLDRRFPIGSRREDHGLIILTI